MSLIPGQTLSFYEILGSLGAGAMGEVYRAKDTRLDREVAIKVLPEHFADDEERLRRFEREAKSLASLNHPNVAQIHAVDQVEDTCFLVLELVPGETLQERIARGALPVDEALDVCRQIAEGLEAAHEARVVHRDLKPANVRVTPEGVVKVLDFGLAKPTRAGATAEGTSSAEPDSFLVTEEGLVLGTPIYMSPEQARGKPVDRRTDIWAFGCVLYECLTGKRAFGGETLTDVLGAIVHEEPEWELLPPRVPTRVRELLRRCLSKDARSRLRDIGDARVELEEILADPTATVAIAPVSDVPPARKHRLVLLLLVGVSLGAGATWRGLLALRPGPTVRRFRIEPRGLELTSSVPFRISPDGQRVLYRADFELWVRELDTLEPRRLAGTEGATHAFWSPDSRSVGFAAAHKLWRLPIGGGLRAAITALPTRISRFGSAIWLDDDTIVWTTGEEGDSIWQVPAGGGDPSVLLTPDPELVLDLHQMAALPDGKGVLVVVHPSESAGGGNQLAVLARGGSELRPILTLEGDDSIWWPCVASSGHVLYHFAGSPGIWALPFSSAELSATGEPFLVVPEGSTSSVSRDGTLVHSLGSVEREVQLVWSDREGTVESEIGMPFSGATHHPILSPDSRLVAVTSNYEGDDSIWLLDTESGSRRRVFLQQDGRAVARAWTPSGDQLLIGRGVDQIGVELLSADGSGTTRSVGLGWPQDVTPDGRFMIVERPTDADNFSIVPLDGSGEEVPFLVGPGDKNRARLSPDGHFATYWTDELGRDEVYVTRFPSGTGRWLVFEDEGRRPIWSAAGDEIFFRSGTRLMVAPITTEGTLSIGPAQELFDTAQTGLELRRGYDVSADGRRILMLRSPDGDENDVIVVIENWLAEFADR